MKKIYLLGAALLSMTALAQAMTSGTYTVYNGTGEDITLVMTGDNVHGTIANPYRLKKGNSKIFKMAAKSGEGVVGVLGPIKFAFTHHMRLPRYVVFEHSHQVLDGQIRHVFIDLLSSSSYRDVTGKQRPLPRLMQTGVVGQNIALGDFTARIVKKIVKFDVTVDKW